MATPPTQVPLRFQTLAVPVLVPGYRLLERDVGHALANADTAIITDLGAPHTIHPLIAFGDAYGDTQRLRLPASLATGPGDGQVSMGLDGVRTERSIGRQGIALRLDDNASIVFEDAVLADCGEIFGEVGRRLDGRPELFGAQVANHVAGHVVGGG